MSWRDQLQEASYKGVPFFVTTESMPVGRRTQLHEYPQRDTVYVEDLGRKTRIIQFTAWLSSDDVYAERDALIAVLDEVGSGELVHPWYGRLNVTPGDCKVTHEKSSGRYVAFDLQFIESGENFPSTKTSTAAAISEAATSLSSFEVANFGGLLDLKNIQDSLGEFTDMFDSLSSQLDGATSFFDEIMGYVSNGQSLITDLIDKPLGFAERIFGAVNGAFRQFGSFGDTFKGIESRFKAITKLKKTSSGTGASAPVRSLISSALVVDVARDIAKIPATDPTPPPLVPDTTPVLNKSASDSKDIIHESTGNGYQPEVTTEDIVEVKDTFNRELIKMMRESSPERYAELNKLRIATVAHLNAVAVNRHKLKRVQVPVSHALVLSYREYENSTLAGEICIRNGQKHPGFIVGDLELVKR